MILRRFYDYIKSMDIIIFVSVLLKYIQFNTLHVDSTDSNHSCTNIENIMFLSTHSRIWHAIKI
jgi:hypothetical protein